ncbi:MAG: hypothetical protein LBB30_04270 [Candidatus Methanoplasma sp.]|jgi:colicin import membrane protein|nr:hypothetical protein [Candidatus Methanoplasma sp.]
MATALKDEKIIGGVGIAAVVAFFVAMFIAVFMNEDFSFGTGTLSDLFVEDAFVAGCVAAGILGAIFGLLITYKKPESKLFIGKVRGILMILSGVALVILGLTTEEQFHIWVVYLFTALIILSATSDMFCNWIADQKIIMVFSLLLTLIIALTGILCQIGENNITGFLFIIFVSFWVLLAALMRFAPVEEAAPETSKKTKKKEKKAKAKENEAKKKNAPAPRPYPVKKEEPPAQKKPAAEKTVYREKPRKVELPKKEEPRKEELKKEEPKKELPPVQKKEPVKPAEPEVKKELPKLKIMSSREAAAARDIARKKEEPPAEPVKEETVPELAAEPVKEEAAQEPIAEEPESEPVEADLDEDSEEYDESFEVAEDTPDALLRRATWNKGLRCRRDYGEHQIPIAYVKAKVAVFVETEAGDTSADEELRADGWTVLRYKESSITDGKEQAEDINRAVKENLKAERAAKKKKISKK